MKKKMKKLSQKGFTLLEMLIVLFVISLLLLLFVPNVTKHQQDATNTGDEAFRQVLQTQVDLYRLKNKENPSVEELDLTTDQEAKFSQYDISPEGKVTKK